MPVQPTRVVLRSKNAQSPSASSTSSGSDCSLDDDDDRVTFDASSASCLDVAYDRHAVKLCADMLTLMGQLKKLAERRDHKASRFAEKPGADIYELTLDRVRGSLSVKRVQEIVEGLDAAKREARESLANEIEKRKADVAGLEKEVLSLGIKIQEKQGKGVELVLQQLVSTHAMIGKHKKILKELEDKSEVEVKVKVKRVSACVELMPQMSSEGREVWMVPKRDAGIYVMGGTGHWNAMLSSVERYDVAQNRWEAVGSMNCKRFNAGSAVLDGKIYAVGGWSGTSLSSVECFSPKSGRWEMTAPLVTARQGCAVGAINGRLYLAGGFDGKRYLSSFRSYDSEGNRMQDLAPMTHRRGAAGGAVLDGCFVVVGGFDGKTRWRTVERYYPATNRWERVAPMNRKRSGCAAVVCNGYLYALGGYDGSSFLSSVERFDPRLNKWEKVASMKCKRALPAAAVLGNFIYVIGGKSAGKTLLSSVERYDPATNRWEMMAPMSSVRSWATAVVAS